MKSREKRLLHKVNRYWTWGNIYNYTITMVFYSLCTSSFRGESSIHRYIHINARKDTCTDTYIHTHRHTDTYTHTQTH